MMQNRMIIEIFCQISSNRAFCFVSLTAYIQAIVLLLSGYLKKHQSTLFRPPLPLHKLHSIQRLGFGTNNKIFVEFDSPWWDTDCEVIHLLWEDEVSCVVSE